MAKAGPRLLILFLLGAGALRADLAGAKAAYARGIEREKAKDYPAAIAEYKAALAEDPDYIYARRQLGNCHYYSGDKDAALADYDAYLALKPDDSDLKAFSDRLRGELHPDSRPAETAVLAEPPLDHIGLQDAFYLGLSLGGVFTAPDDMQQLVPGVVINDTIAILGTAKAGFFSESGFWIEGAYSYGPFREYPILYTSSSSSFSYEDTFTLSESTFSFEPGFRVPLSHKVALGAGIAVGLSTDTLTYTSTIFPTQTFTGSNTSISPELRCSVVFNRIGIDIDVGYHISKSGTMKDSSGAPLVVTNIVTGSGSNWQMDNSGGYVRVGAVFYFSRPLLAAPPRRRRHES